ncbi:MAG: hypothetical protein K2N35_04725 [Muribaculaceae bacterium]|nr:hypothetical protein [Muribaculaceae bacterium]
MDCTPINRLRLTDAFQDIQKFQTIQSDDDYLIELFEWTDRGTVYVYDDENKGHSTYVTDTKGLGADKTLQITNPTHKDLFLWHIDGVLYKRDSKCDCAFLTDTDLGFVEFKANAANESQAAIKANYEKASSQLLLTFNDIDQRCKKIGIDMCKVVTVEAYAVFNRTVPKNNAHKKNISRKFLKATNERVLLTFCNQVTIN